MRIITLAAAASLMTAGAALAQTAPAAPAAPAAAAAPRVLTAPAGSTIAVILEKGEVLSIMGMDIEISFKPTGEFDGGVFAGTYHVDGNKLCLTSDFGDSCSVYPDGKKSGDTFQIEVEQLGPIDVKIK